MPRARLKRRPVPAIEATDIICFVSNGRTEIYAELTADERATFQRDLDAACKSPQRAAQIIMKAIELRADRRRAAQ